MSPNEIIRAPGPNSSATPTDQDRRVPRKGDAVIIAGRKRAIEAAGGIYLGGPDSRHRCVNAGVRCV